jgi:FkbM family methyltransferase
MTFFAYGQNFEDVILYRALRHVSNGFYIDLGANDPKEDSVTKAFYDAGWSGVNIEPMSFFYKKLVAERLRDTNLQVAVGQEKSRLKFYEIPMSGLSTTSHKVAEQHIQAGLNPEETSVEVLPLSLICEKYAATRDIHFLKIDVEGAEKEALLGADLEKFRPWIIVIEATHPNTNRENFQEWEYVLLEAQYSLCYRDGLNRFYLAKEHNELRPHFDLPPNVFDNFRLANNFIMISHDAVYQERDSLLLENEDLHSQLKSVKFLVRSLKAVILNRFS